MSLGEYHDEITNSFLKVVGMLSDEDGNVRESALQAVYAVANSGEYVSLIC